MRTRHKKSFALLLCAALLSQDAILPGPPVQGPPRANPVARHAAKRDARMETAALSRQLRKELALPEQFQGAVGGRSLPGRSRRRGGDPAARQSSNRSTRRGSKRLRFVSAAYTGPATGALVLRGRAPPSKRRSSRSTGVVSEEKCRHGIATACFRRATAFWTRNQGLDRQYATELYQTRARPAPPRLAPMRLHLVDQRTPRRELSPPRAVCELRSGAGCAHLIPVRDGKARHQR